MDHSVVLTFYTHGSIDDDYAHFGYMMNTFTSMLSISCHILDELDCFPHSHKYPIITLCIHQILCVGIKPCEYAMYSRCSR